MCARYLLLSSLLLSLAVCDFTFPIKSLVFFTQGHRIQIDTKSDAIFKFYQGKEETRSHSFVEITYNTNSTNGLSQDDIAYLKTWALEMSSDESKSRILFSLHYIHFGKNRDGTHKDCGVIIDEEKDIDFELSFFNPKDEMRNFDLAFNFDSKNHDELYKLYDTVYKVCLKDVDNFQMKSFLA